MVSSRRCGAEPPKNESARSGSEDDLAHSAVVPKRSYDVVDIIVIVFQPAVESQVPYDNRQGGACPASPSQVFCLCTQVADSQVEAAWRCKYNPSPPLAYVDQSMPCLQVAY